MKLNPIVKKINAVVDGVLLCMRGRLVPMMMRTLMHQRLMRMDSMMMMVIVVLKDTMVERMIGMMD